MNKFILSIFSSAIFLCALTVNAATTSESTDDARPLDKLDTPQIKEQNKKMDKKFNNKSIKKNGGVGYENSMNKKPIGTTSGQSKNGSEDITNDGPVNGTVKGTN